MLLEETRFLHEDLERLEQGISDRLADEPKHACIHHPLRSNLLSVTFQIRDRLARDHQISDFLNRIQNQSKRLLDVYSNAEGRTKEIQAISTGDPFVEFYKNLNETKAFHRRYPNEPVENLERAYKRRVPVEGESATAEVDNMFTGEEAFGRFLDLTLPHEEYLNLPGIKRMTYLQYLDNFDSFTPPQCTVKRQDKETDVYFNYVGGLASYLENFMRRTKPLEDLDKLFASFDQEFTKLWDADEIPAWAVDSSTSNGPARITEGTGEGIWCSACAKEFKNDNVYKAHLTGKRHLKAAAAEQSESSANAAPAKPTSSGPSTQRLKQRAIAEREHRVSSLAKALDFIRTATRVNVERKQGMTERERQQELDALFAESADAYPGEGADDSDADSDSSDKIYNPLKLPLAWDGKPIPFWLYKLHGLGVEFPCEICGNFVYMGRRAFDKHFSEGRHVYGLKCLGITNTALFREITKIEDALKLWNKLQGDKKMESGKGDVVQMEDAEGNVMPEKVYYEYATSSALFTLLLESDANITCSSVYKSKVCYKAVLGYQVDFKVSQHFRSTEFLGPRDIYENQSSGRWIEVSRRSLVSGPYGNHDSGRIWRMK